MFRRFFSFFRKKLFSGTNEDNSKFTLEKLGLLEEIIEIKFGKTEFYIKALTHRSFLELTPELKKSNERLEFLGDAVLGLVVADSLFREFPNKHEGYLTKYRSHLVDKDALFQSAKKINLIEFVLFDRRYVRGSEQGEKTIVADCMEALIGAIYIDKGLETARDFINRWIIQPKFKSGDVKVDKNFKGRFLEFTHSHKMEPPRYMVISEEGPDHNKKFIVEVLVGDESYGRGEGKNKKSAEQEAAKAALQKAQNQNNQY